VQEVAVYDERMRRLRDIDSEIREVIETLGISAGSVVLEIGTGTAEFAISAAERGARVYAIDISEVMLQYARQKAESRGVSGIEFIHAGFLSYEHQGEPLDAVVTQLALHHLPDYWKAAALTRVCDMIKTGGLLLLDDIVFTGDVRLHGKAFDEMIEGIASSGGEENALSTARHIRNEYSTLDWIMEGIIRSAGFSILSADYNRGVVSRYVCRKNR
jgi:ubiquinone/menaquinone biosynthesis C-methylase UbiE